MLRGGNRDLGSGAGLDSRWLPELPGLGSQPDIGVDRESTTNGEELEEWRVTWLWHALMQTRTGTEAVGAEGRGCRSLGRSSVDPSVPVLRGDATAQGMGLKGRLHLCV